MDRLNVKVVPRSLRDQIVGRLKAQPGFPISLQHREHRLSELKGHSTSSNSCVPLQIIAKVFFPWVRETTYRGTVVPTVICLPNDGDRRATFSMIKFFSPLAGQGMKPVVGNHMIRAGRRPAGTG